MTATQIPATQNLGGTFSFPHTDLTVNRMGYGAMQLAGKGVFGPPRDRAAALAVLREAVSSGVDHIDTSDFYGPHVTNQIIREALHPYPDNLVIVTKVGVRRTADAGWNPAFSRADITEAVHDNLRNLGLDRLAIVNLRPTSPTIDIEEPFTALAELQGQGLIEHLGISSVGREQFQKAQSIAPVICVQNLYNIAHRDDDAFLDELAAQGIPYVPWFPLGGFNPLQESALNEIAASLGATPMQVALSWLLHRSPNILLIPGTSSVEHLRENLAAASLQLPAEVQTKLDGLAGNLTWMPPHR